MRSVVLLAIVAFLCACTTSPTSSTRGRMLIIEPPADAVNAGVRPYSIPWPKGADGQLLAGETIVLALVNTAGTVDQVRVESTSGIPALDGAAAESVHRWHFIPATRNGVPIAGYVRIPVMMDPSRNWSASPSSVSTRTGLPTAKSPWGQLTHSSSSDGSQ